MDFPCMSFSTRTFSWLAFYALIWCSSQFHASASPGGLPQSIFLQHVNPYAHVQKHVLYYYQLSWKKSSTKSALLSRIRVFLSWTSPRFLGETHELQAGNGGFLGIPTFGNHLEFFLQSGKFSGIFVVLRYAGHKGIGYSVEARTNVWFLLDLWTDRHPRVNPR